MPWGIEASDVLSSASLRQASVPFAVERFSRRPRERPTTMYVVDLGQHPSSLKSYKDFAELYKRLVNSGLSFNFPGRGDARGPAIEFRRRRFDRLIRIVASMDQRRELLEDWLSTGLRERVCSPKKNPTLSPTTRLNAALLGSVSKKCTLTRTHASYVLRVECDDCRFVSSQPYKVFRAANDFFCEAAPPDVARLYDAPSLEDWCEISLLVALEHLSPQDQHQFLSVFEFDDEHDVEEEADDELTTSIQAMFATAHSFDVTVGREGSGYWARVVLQHDLLTRTYFAKPQPLEKYVEFISKHCPKEELALENDANLRCELTRLFATCPEVVFEFSSEIHFLAESSTCRRNTFDIATGENSVVTEEEEKEGFELRFALDEVFGLEDEFYKGCRRSLIERAFGVAQAPPRISVVASMVGVDEQRSDSPPPSFDPCWAPPAVATFAFSSRDDRKRRQLLVKVYDDEEDAMLGYAVIRDLDRVVEKQINLRLIDDENMSTSARVSGSLSIRSASSVVRSEEQAVRQHCVLMYQKCSRRKPISSLLRGTPHRRALPTTTIGDLGCCSTDVLSGCRHAGVTIPSPSCCDEIEDARDRRATWIPCGSYVPTDALRPYDDDVQANDLVDLPISLDELLPLSQGEYIVEEWHQARRKDGAEKAFSFVQYAPSLQSKVWTTQPTSSSTYRRTVFFRLTTRDPAVRRPFASTSPSSSSTESSSTCCSLGNVYKHRRRRVNGNPGMHHPLRSSISRTYGGVCTPRKKSTAADRDPKKAFAATRAAAILDASNFPYIMG